jgi:glycine cleavage system aminomethyltransferase T
MRDRAGMVDLSAFAVFDVLGPGALQAVQGVAVRQMDVPVGRVVYTPVLTPGGGFRSDLTIMRLDDEVFRVVTGGAHGAADRKWFADRLPQDGTAQIADLTSAWTTLGLWGPRARDILQSVTRDDVSHEGFRFGSCRTIEIDTLRVLASRISYVGELGWELYVPIEQGQKLWNVIAEAGRPHGVAPVGIGVYGTTGRLEKCYRAYGFELESEYNVCEAGMAGPKVKDEDFVGREAHLRHRDEQPAAIMCTLTVDDHTSASGVKRYMLGREPIQTRDGQPLTDSRGRRSYVTSAGAGPSVGKHLLMAYLPPEQAQVGTELAVEYLNERYPVTVAVAGLFGLHPQRFPKGAAFILCNAMETVALAVVLPVGMERLDALLCNILDLIHLYVEERPLRKNTATFLITSILLVFICAPLYASEPLTLPYSDARVTSGPIPEVKTGSSVYYPSGTYLFSETDLKVAARSTARPAYGP